MPSSTLAAATPQQPHDLSAYTSKLVFRIDVFLIASISFFVLITLPRAFVHFSRASEWTQGNLLRTVDIDRIRLRRPLVLNEWYHLSPTAGKGIEVHSEDSLNYNSRLVRRRPSGKRPTPSYPPHLAAWPTFMLPLARILRHRLSPGFSLGQVLLLLGYSAVMVYGWFYRSNPITDPNRTGVVSVSQIPFVFMFATKNNLLGMVIGLGYEKVGLLPYHQKEWHAK
jgi:ferric-chelate reductase